MSAWYEKTVTPWGSRSLWQTGGPERAKQLTELVERADRECTRGDGRSLSTAVRKLLPLAPEELGFDLVAIVELGVLDPELAAIRWSNLRPKLQ